MIDKDEPFDSVTLEGEMVCFLTVQYCLEV